MNGTLSASCRPCPSCCHKHLGLDNVIRGSLLSPHVHKFAVPHVSCSCFWISGCSSSYIRSTFLPSTFALIVSPVAPRLVRGRWHECSPQAFTNVSLSQEAFRSSNRVTEILGITEEEIGPQGPTDLAAWLFFQIAAGHIALPVLTATFIFARTVTKIPALIVVCITWILSAVFSTLL